MRRTGLTYIDTSAFVKRIVVEPGSDALHRFLGTHPELVSSALLRTEAIRAVRQQDPEVLTDARSNLEGVYLVRLTDELLDVAGELDPLIMRSLDSIHLATALSLRDDLDALVTYDERMIEGARLLGLPVSAPA